MQLMKVNPQRLITVMKIKIKLYMYMAKLHIHCTLTYRVYTAMLVQFDMC